MSKLIEIAKNTKGNVEDCDIVVQKSGQYRQGQDYLAEFVTERIEAQEGEKIQKGEVYSEFKQWYNMQYGRKVPQGKELYDFLDKKNVNIKGTLLKPNMVVSGTENNYQAPIEEVAEKTLQCLKSSVPDELPGIVF